MGCSLVEVYSTGSDEMDALLEEAFIPYSSGSRNTFQHVLPPAQKSQEYILQKGLQTRAKGQAMQ